MSKLKTLDRALHILDFFTEENKSWGLRELAETAKINHTVLYRILSTFEEHGFVNKNVETGKYELGLKFWKYNFLLQDKIKSKDLFNPYMKHLVEETNETAYLSWLEGYEAVCVDIVHSNNNVKYDVKIGMYKPLYAGASNKIILAYLDKELQKEILSKELKVYTNETVTNQDKLLLDLKTIKDNGWCITYGEFNENIVGISVPLFDFRNRVFGSLNVAGPMYRMNKEKIEDILEQLLKTREEINNDLKDIFFVLNNLY